VAGLSLPYMPPGPVDLLTALASQGIKTFYVQYFQTPGIAEAEFEADIAASLRRANCSLSGDGRGGVATVLEPGKGFLQNTEAACPACAAAMSCPAQGTGCSASARQTSTRSPAWMPWAWGRCLHGGWRRPALTRCLLPPPGQATPGPAVPPCRRRDPALARTRHRGRALRLPLATPCPGVVLAKGI